MIKGYTVGKNEYTGELHLTIFPENGDPIGLIDKDLIEVKDSINTIFSFLETVKSPEEQEKDKLIEIINENNKLKTSIDELISKYAEFVETKEDYQVNKLYKVGDTFKYNGVVYAVVQEHTSQEDWKPDSTLSLYKVLNSTVEADTEVVIAEFKQPTGAHDAYQLGDKILFNGRVYESIHPTANTWSPTDYPQAWTDLGLIEEYQGA